MGGRDGEDGEDVIGRAGFYGEVPGGDLMGVPLDRWGDRRVGASRVTGKKRVTSRKRAALWSRQDAPRDGIRHGRPIAGFRSAIGEREGSLFASGGPPPPFRT